VVGRLASDECTQEGHKVDALCPLGVFWRIISEGQILANLGRGGVIDNRSVGQRGGRNSIQACGFCVLVGATEMAGSIVRKALGAG